MHPNDAPDVKPTRGIERSPAEIAARSPRTVAVLFPKPITLTLGHGESITYPAGTHEVPEVLSTHWYLKACGATVQAS